MSLKRKASFSNVGSPSSPIAGPECTMMDISPRHLHSRTRKRYRNDRPDEKVVYENTLRWLFTAQQKRHQGPTPTMDEEENGMDSEPLSAPETVDPRQQTLHKFFQPSQSSAARARAHTTVTKFNTQSTISFPQPSPPDIRPTMVTTGSDTTVSLSSPAPYTDMDVDMDVDMDSSSDQSVQAPNRWPGELGWM